MFEEQVMLNGLDNISWETLNHAYGSAEDVPDLIRALTYDGDDMRDMTLYTLYSNLWHQGTVYQATAYAVPFLIELLTVNHVTRKYDILIYLAHLATGNSYLDILTGQGINLYNTGIEDELNHVKQTHHAVREGIEVYFQLLLNRHEDIQTRMAVPYLLASFPEQQAMIVPRLKQILPDESDRLMRASIILALRYLQPTQGSTYYLEPYLAPDEDLIVRACSAMAVAHIREQDTQSRVVTLLLAILKNSSGIEVDYEQLTWSEGDIVGDICKSLMHVGYDKLDAIIPDMVGVLRRVDFFSALTCVDALLYIVFGGIPSSTTQTAHDLTTHQRLVLEAILNSPNTWRISLNEGETMLNGNIGTMMQAYNLPANPDAMRDFLRR
jgi:hypothetical protein